MNKNDKKNPLKHLTYNTPVSVIEKAERIKLDVEPDTKFGDFLRLKGYKSLAQMLRELNFS